jgi:DNA-binding LytR/AlgR family response regulator
MANSGSVTALIADDEAPMREQLKTRLEQVWPELEIVAEASNGIAAIEQAEIHKPDIIFLDIRMPGNAIEAFKQGAMDYLLKPVDADRLRTTCERLQQRLDKTNSATNTQASALPDTSKAEQIETMLKKIMQHSQGGKHDYLRWIQASVGTSLRMISTKEILFFRSDEKYTRVQTEHAEFLIRKSLKELEDELDPDEFWRIHRSTLVRVDAIGEVTRDFRGRQLIQLKGHPEKLEVSRNHGHLFQQM